MIKSVLLFAFACVFSSFNARYWHNNFRYNRCYDLPRDICGDYGRCRPYYKGPLYQCECQKGSFQSRLLSLNAPCIKCDEEIEKETKVCETTNKPNPYKRKFSTETVTKLGNFNRKCFCKKSCHFEAENGREIIYIKHGQKFLTDDCSMELLCVDGETEVKRDNFFCAGVCEVVKGMGICRGNIYSNFIPKM